MPTREEVAALRERISNRLFTRVVLQELNEDELEGVPETDLFSMFLMSWVPLTVGRTDTDMVLILGKPERWPSGIVRFDQETAWICGLSGTDEHGQVVEITGDVIKRMVLREDGTEVERDALKFKFTTCDHIFTVIEHLARGFFYPYTA